MQTWLCTVVCFKNESKMQHAELSECSKESENFCSENGPSRSGSKESENNKKMEEVKINRRQKSAPKSAGPRKTYRTCSAGCQRRVKSAGAVRDAYSARSCRSLNSARSQSSLILKEMCQKTKINTYEQKIPIHLSLDLSDPEVLVKILFNSFIHL